MAALCVVLGQVRGPLSLLPCYRWHLQGWLLPLCPSSRSLWEGARAPGAHLPAATPHQGTLGTRPCVTLPARSRLPPLARENTYFSTRGGGLVSGLLLTDPSALRGAKVLMAHTATSATHTSMPSQEPGVRDGRLSSLSQCLHPVLGCSSCSAAHPTPCRRGWSLYYPCGVPRWRSGLLAHTWPSQPFGE